MIFQSFLGQVVIVTVMGPNKMSHTAAYTYVDLIASMSSCFVYLNIHKMMESEVYERKYFPYN